MWVAKSFAQFFNRQPEVLTILIAGFIRIENVEGYHDSI